MRINFGFCDYFSVTGQNAPIGVQRPVAKTVRKHRSLTSVAVPRLYRQNAIIKSNELPAFAPVGSTGPVKVFFRP